MSLPLKAKVSIRDLWSNDDAPARKAITDLRAALGRDVVCEPEWALLIAELNAGYKEKADGVITAVTSCVRVWCAALTEVLEDEENETWGEEMLQKLEEAGSRSLKLFVEISKSDKPSTSWVSRGGFTLLIPNTQIHHGIMDFMPIFKAQFLNAFARKTTAPPADDFDDIAGDVPVIIPSRTASASASASAAPGAREVEYLADANTLARPDQLLLQPPYYLFIYGDGPTITVQCTHSPSLELLATYLGKWCRANNNHHDRAPLVSIRLCQSPFGLGLMHDTLILELQNYSIAARELSPGIILNLVESVLGYKIVYTDSNRWQYRKDSPLKQL